MDNLATTTDGSALYFSGSLHLKGVPPGWIVRYHDETGTFEQCVALSSLGPARPGSSGWAYASFSEVSADGRLVAWYAYGQCRGQNCASGQVPYSFNINPASSFTEHALAGSSASWGGLSRNGKYTFGDSQSLASLTDGSMTPLGGSPFEYSGLGISDSGQAVVNLNSDDGSSSFRPILAGKAPSVPLALSRRPNRVRLSRDGRHIVYESVAQAYGTPRPDAPPYELYFYDVASKQGRLIATGPALNQGTYSYFYPNLDDSGNELLYVNAPSPGALPQIFLWTIGDSLPVRPITSISEGVSRAVISGSGSIVYAATLSNRLLRIDLATGAITELSGRTPIVQFLSGNGTCAAAVGAVVGSLTTVRGSGLVDADGGASVKVGGEDAFVVSATTDRIDFQVPWESAVTESQSTQVSFSIGSAADSIFVTPASTISLCQSSPLFIAPAVHEDFRGPVLSSDPARNGEILHFYMTGLGPVSPPAQTGAIASSNPLQDARLPQCQLSPELGEPHTSIDVTPLFAGLAPGLIGIYQLDAKIPSLPPTQVGFNVADFRCVDSYGHSDTTAFYYRL